jgi:hypothetical protein
MYKNSWLSLKDGIPARNYGISAGISYQILKSASDREFYSLYDAIHEFTKFEFS